MSPSSDASRPLSQPRTGILTPASDGSGNRLSSRDRGPIRKVSAGSAAAVPDATRRPARTRPALPMEELLKPSIVVKPHPPNVLAKPVTLQPLMLLPRECLPLAHIDLADPYGELPPARFFESRIRIMELEGRLGSNTLIARSESSRISYAIERHENGRYVVCKLGSWVDMAELVHDSTVACGERLKLPKTATVDAGCLEPPLITPQIYQESKRKRQAIEDLQSLCKKRQRSQSVTSIATQQPHSQLQQLQEQQLPQCHLPTPVDDLPRDDKPVASPAAEQQPPAFPFQEEAQLPMPAQQTANVLDTKQTAGDIFNHIRAQYLEILYHSMGSLAYFAKGPLSRARAAFNLNCDGILDMADLIGFLKSLVLTTILIDNKYLTTIPGLIEQMKLDVESSDEERATRLKKRSSKKMRIGKDGLYPGEDDNIRRWWARTRPELRDEETSVNPQQVRYHISCLRRRETLLQLILILEILSLEGSQQLENPVDIQLPGLEAALSQGPAKSADTTKKKRNKHNLPVLLDVHADRLCIWESTTLDDVKALAESQSRTGEVRKSDRPLVDFCIDVILPFFSSRLPEPCDLLNRKLGGPVLKSPPKQRREKGAESSSKPRAKPGAPAKRPTAKSASSSKSARSLERVLSNDKLRRSVSRGPSDALAHLRHATVSHVPGLKREASETRVLKEIPLTGTSSLTDRQANPQLSRSASFTSAEDARAKKKALVEAELQDAISALKKPNRVLAGKVLVEETERRLFAGPTYVTKPKKPAPSPVSNKVQVKATPANVRFKNALANDPDNGRGFNLSRAYQALQLDYVASRTAAEPGRLGLTHSPCVTNTPLGSKVRQPWGMTSSKGYDVDSHEREDENVPTSSPIQPRKRAPRPQPPQWGRPTPSRGLFQPALADMVPASSPRRLLDEDEDPLSTGAREFGKARSRTQSLAETPVKPRPRPMDASTVSVSALVMDRPRAKRAISPVLPPISVAVSPPKAAQTKTIYQQLGWDDDYPDELL